MTRPVLPPEGVVAASVEASLVKLGAHNDELKTLLNHEVSAVMDMEAEYPVRRQRMIAIVKSINKIVGPIAACRRGCSHCCNMAVATTSQEAQIIAKATGRTARNAPMVLDESSLVLKYMNVPCPFLKDSECSIYEIRPMVCRTYFNVSAFPQLCDTVNHPGMDVPGIDLRAITFADSIGALEDGGVINDIREFFPPVVATNCTDTP